MKNATRILTAVLVLALCAGMTACAGEGGAQTSSAASVTGSSESFSGALSPEEETSSAEEIPLVNEEGYVIVRNMIDHLDLSFSDDCSACFPADAEGYYIEGGPYKVAADTLRRIVNVPCKGDGTVQWIGFKEYAGSGKDPFTGIVPANKLNDPVYMTMNLPSEAKTYMSDRINPGNMKPYVADHNRALAIGAVYRNEENKPADDETFTLCFGRIALMFKTPERGWYIANEASYPTPNHIYGLPWEKAGNYTLPTDRLDYFDDYVEVTVTGADLNGKNSATGADAACLHFWSGSGYIKGGEALACASSYVVWVKEPAAVDKLVATIGVDWYSDSNPKANIQAYYGYNYLVTNEPRLLYGHNVGPKAYDSVMEPDTVAKMLGVK